MKKNNLDLLIGTNTSNNHLETELAARVKENPIYIKKKKSSRQRLFIEKQYNNLKFQSPRKLNRKTRKKYH